MPDFFFLKTLNYPKLLSKLTEIIQKKTKLNYNQIGPEFFSDISWFPTLLPQTNQKPILAELEIEPSFLNIRTHHISPEPKT